MFALVRPCACLSVCHALPALSSRLYNCTQSVPLTIIGISYFYQRSANSRVFCYIDNYFTSLGAHARTRWPSLSISSRIAQRFVVVFFSSLLLSLCVSLCVSVLLLFCVCCVSLCVLASLCACVSVCPLPVVFVCLLVCECVPCALRLSLHRASLCLSVCARASASVRCVAWLFVN